MAKILLLYSTTDGHTLRICQRISQTVEGRGNQVTLREIGSRDDLHIEDFDQIVIGARIRYGRHSRATMDFISRNRAMLDQRPSAFFSVNIVARKPGKDGPQTNPYVRNFLRQTGWRPRHVGVFAGRLNYPEYGPFDRIMIRLIMYMTGGPTDTTRTYEFTDWNRVDAFARLLVNISAR